MTTTGDERLCLLREERGEGGANLFMAVFHGWTQELLHEETTTGHCRTHVRVCMRGVIEFEDGHMGVVEPEKIYFLDTLAKERIENYAVENMTRQMEEAMRERVKSEE